jgi:hypothetical protein
MSSAKILFAITMAVYIVVTLLCCYTTKPKVTEGEFPFSITYEYKGETKTLSGVFCFIVSQDDVMDAMTKAMGKGGGLI